jgi:signal transduction histidine kinase
MACRGKSRQLKHQTQPSAVAMGRKRERASGAMSARQKARAAFASAVVLLLLSGIAAYVAVARLVGSAEWVIHTFQVQAAIGDVDSAIATAGRARAAYVFNGNHVSSAEFEAAASEVPKAIQRLRELTRDNPQEQQLCSRLESVTQHRIGLFRDSIQLANASPRDQSGQGELTNQSAVFASETTQVMQQMREEEQRLLHSRERLSTRLFILVVVILVSTLVLALGLFSVHFRLLSGELTAREQAERTARNSEESLRRLTVRLLKLRDAERRKISRELHDSLGQYLSGVKMNLDRLARAYGDQESLREALHLLDQAIVETRTISYLLHPPLLDETGLASAAKWYIEGFARRSGIEVSADIPADLGRLPEPLELGLFRVLQESLTNIHRHSKSSKAEILLRRLPDKVVLDIRDYGQGIPPGFLNSQSVTGPRAGVGLAGMRERIHELGGALDIQSGASGTLISVTMPLPPRAKAADASGGF